MTVTLKGALAPLCALVLIPALTACSQSNSESTAKSGVLNERNVAEVAGDSDTKGDKGSEIIEEIVEEIIEEEKDFAPPADEPDYFEKGPGQHPGQHPGQNPGQMPTPEGTILSAFYGVTDAPAVSDLNTCGFTEENRVDGLPVTFRQEIENQSLDIDDIVVILEDGTRVTPLCATLEPSPEENEDRTVLLSGLFGDPADNPPVRVEVVGDLYSEAVGETPSLNLKGLSANVIAFDEGPEVVYAEIISDTELELTDSDDTISEACPRSATRSAVRLTWSGGVSRPGPGRLEISDDERLRYEVTVRGADGGLSRVVPFAIGDLFDQDNMQDLCLDIPGTPIRVSVLADTVVDPANDFNEAVNVSVGPAE